MGDQMPLPPEEFMKLVCGENHEDIVAHFKWAGKLLTGMLAGEDMLNQETRFLDVGCGCGRVARYLLNRPIQAYIGFDRHPGMIQWCQEQITPHAPHFHFHCFDIKTAYSVLDGHEGTMDASSFRFPFPDASFDAVLLASVFTHMPMEESAHYLEELHRILDPNGKILLSVFFADQEPYTSGIDFHYVPEAFLDMIREELYHHHWHVLTCDPRSTPSAMPIVRPKMIFSTFSRY